RPLLRIELARRRIVTRDGIVSLQPSDLADERAQDAAHGRVGEGGEAVGVEVGVGHANETVRHPRAVPAEAVIDLALPLVVADPCREAEESEVLRELGARAHVLEVEGELARIAAARAASGLELEPITRDAEGRYVLV